MQKIRAIVTGASSGIGHATAELLIERGLEVVAAARSVEKLRDLADKCVIHSCDVTSRQSCDELVVAAHVGDRTPVLVNAAGAAWFGSFDEQTELGMQIETNLLGPIYLSRAIIPWMLDAGGGHIVNVCSVAATHPFSGAAVYCASKAGLHMFGKALAAEYRARGIRVTSLLPGSVDTPLWDSQSFEPNRADMLSARAVAECIRDVILSPPDRSYDEIVLMPPKGIL